MYGVTCHHLITFDSAAPGTILRSVQVFADDSSDCLGAIDVDPQSGAIYVSHYYLCFMLCPPTGHDVSRLDPETGALDPIWIDPGDGLPFSAWGDFDIDPASGEIRSPGYPIGSNVHIEVPSGALVADTPYSLLREVSALAFDPAGAALALAPRETSPEDLDIFLLGGPGGVPPASSGELTQLASITTGIGASSYPTFDISPTGAAYLLASYWPPGLRVGEGVPSNNLLFTVDLASGALVPLGEVASPDNGWPLYTVTGIAVAGARGAIAIPALEGGGVATLAVLLAAAGAWLLARRESLQGAGLRRCRGGALARSRTNMEGRHAGN